MSSPFGYERGLKKVSLALVGGVELLALSALLYHASLNSTTRATAYPLNAPIYLPDGLIRRVTTGQILDARYPL